MTVFGTTKAGKEVTELTIGAGDLTVNILNYGAIVKAVHLAGVPYSLSLGSDQLSDYEDTMQYFGSIVGPIANRISNARVRLEGMMYELERNQDGAVHLHSGADGVHRKVWDVTEQTADRAVLTLSMPDGTAGLPGRRVISVTYQVKAPATLTMTIDGTTDTATCMNFASHIYWNLDGSNTLAGHQMRLAADHYLPVDDRVCPTGDVDDVEGTDMDFRETRTLEIAAPALDHNYCVSSAVADLRDVLWLSGTSGVAMTVATTEPGLQIHDASGSHRPDKPPYEGVIIEPQRWPDAPNNPRFPSITVKPDNPYQQVTQWRFNQP
jgi:aldose 1-epimerase